MSATGRPRGDLTDTSLWPRTARAPDPVTASIICTAGTTPSATGHRPKGAGYGEGRSRWDGTDPVSVNQLEGKPGLWCVWLQRWCHMQLCDIDEPGFAQPSDGPRHPVCMFLATFIKRCFLFRGLCLRWQSCFLHTSSVGPISRAGRRQGDLLLLLWNLSCSCCAVIGRYPVVKKLLISGFGLS